MGALAAGCAVLGSAAAATAVLVSLSPNIRRGRWLSSILERLQDASTALSSVSNTMRATQRMEQQEQLQDAVRSAMQEFRGDLRQEIQEDIARTTTHLLNSSLHVQERELVKSLGGPLHATATRVETMHTQLRELSHLFVAPKSRGTFGELQLELIIQEILPLTAYSFQQTLSNGKRVDCLLRLPSPIGNLAIDSKFPMMVNETTLPGAGSANQTLDATLRKKELQEKLSKHVHDIATKYIIPGETAESAVLFLPSVALFLEIVENHTDIVLSAHRNKVWLACPTTLAAVLTTLQGVSRGMAVAQRAQEVTQQIHKLSHHIDLLVARFEATEKSIDKTKTELSKMQTSVHKIRKIKLELDALSVLTDDVVLPRLGSTELQSLPSLLTNSEPAITESGVRDETMTSVAPMASKINGSAIQ
jgi:DNA recombination protein RmuC